MTFLRTVFRSFPLRVLGIGVLASLVVIGCRQLALLENLELRTYDWMVRLTTAPVSPDPRIVLVAITEDDLASLDEWPISDETLANVLNILTASGARVIGVDLYRDRDVPPGTNNLHAILSANPRIVTVMKFPDQNGRGVSGPPLLQGTDQIGFNDMLVDPGGIVRRGFLFLEDQQGVATSFSLLLALKYLEKDGIVPYSDPSQPELMRLGTTTIPRFQPSDGGYVRRDARGYQILLKYSGARDSFTRFSLTSLLSGDVPPEAMRDKVVVIGSAAESVRDDFYTPFSLGKDIEQQVPGMELHAHFVSQFLRMALGHEMPVRSLLEELEVGWIIVWGSLGAVLAWWLGSPWRVMLLVGGGVGGMIVVAYWLLLANWWIPLVPTVMAWVSAGGLVTAWVSQRNRQERAMLMQLFSQHVSHEVAETIWAGRDQFLHDGRIRPQHLTATVLFADLEGFTAVAEQLSPPDLMQWLNTYLLSMTNVISAHHGVIDDYFGDGVKANFGVPFARTHEHDIRQDAINAVQCGLALIQDIHRLNQVHARQGIPLGKVRIGVASGSVIAGSVGGRQRLKYTTVGNVVNLAARLEQLGKERSGGDTDQESGSLLITHETRSYLDGVWAIEELGPVELRGKQDSVMVYRVLSGPPERIELTP
ncbi:MAG: adenylate/guanylate cyclase domain-containing protein [Nitrospirales bacterium]|nr:MAG: adenylate/guanylate cyclase domain-containing protein [Nitrospirales bacterium]